MTNANDAKTFDARLAAIGGADAAALASVITAGSDLALILDARGVVRDLVVATPEPALDEARAWLGQEWGKVVTAESRVKVREMLAEALATGHSRRRQVNHPSPHGIDLPIAYSVVRLSPAGDCVALGRDLRALSNLQQRLVEAQQAMERDYWKFRHVETRYRHLFEVASEAVLVVDATTQKILEANPAAVRLLGEGGPNSLVGKSFPPASTHAATRR